jgi:hypothetical protein
MKKKKHIKAVCGVNKAFTLNFNCSRNPKLAIVACKEKMKCIKFPLNATTEDKFVWNVMPLINEYYFV